MPDEPLSTETHRFSEWTDSLGTRAVRRVLRENRERGIPSAFEFRGQLLFEMPDGSLTTDNPFTTPGPGRAEAAAEVTDPDR